MCMCAAWIGDLPTGHQQKSGYATALGAHLGSLYNFLSFIDLTGKNIYCMPILFRVWNAKSVGNGIINKVL